MNNAAIGAFDSGLGGLTVVSQIHKYLPKESIVYFGDTGRVPYGGRSNETILRYAEQDINFLKSHSVKLIVAACGTVSSVATGLSDSLDIPFVEVVTPASEAAVNATVNGRVGVKGFSRANFVCQKRIAAINSDIDVVEYACPLFVPFVESGLISKDDELVIGIANRYLKPLINEKVDTLIMGCTHYPILAPAIQSVMGDSVKLINTGEAAALKIKTILTDKNMLAEKEPEHHFFVSDTTQTFFSTSEILLGKSFDYDVKKIDIEKY